MNNNSALYNAMVAPFQGMAVKGALWYQVGELVRNMRKGIKKKGTGVAEARGVQDRK